MAITMIALTSVDRQPIDINPAEGSSVREPPADHFDHKAKCVIYMTNGEVIAVIEDCHTVNKKMEELRRSPEKDRGRQPK
jgi:hypothetical protein